MKRKNLSAELLAESGYSMDKEKLADFYQQAIGKPLSPGIQNWFEAIAPYLVTAYQVGAEGHKLEDAYPFFEPLEGRRV